MKYGLSKITMYLLGGIGEYQQEFLKAEMENGALIKDMDYEKYCFCRLFRQHPERCS